MSHVTMEPILYAHEIGEGLPILIIHGWEMNGKVEELDFEPIFNEIPGLHRIYVDLPGMGKTPAKNVKNLDDMYFRLVEYIDARLGASRFLVVGSSCGAYLARALAQKYKDQVDGLLLRVPLIEPRNSMRDVDTCEPLITDEDLMSTISNEEKSQLGNVLIHTSAYVDTLQAKTKAIYLPAVSAADKQALEPIREDPLRYRLSPSLNREHAKFLAPTLIVCGRQDETVGYRDSLRLLELYPRSTYIVLDRGTHALPVDEAGLFGSLVRDWITRVNEWRDRKNK